MSSVAFTGHDLLLAVPPADNSSQAPPRLRQTTSYLWTRTVPLENASRWFVDSLHRLHEVATLRDNWNSYGALVPNEIALAHAQSVLHELSDLDFEPSRIDPSAENGVCLSFRVANRYADIECFNSGDVLAITSEGSGQPQVWEVNATSDDLRTAIARIRAFLRPK